jgi:tRNA(adenine34) deaminase
VLGDECANALRSFFAERRRTVREARDARNAVLPDPADPTDSIDPLSIRS